jgi:hypothetical protein
MNATANDNAVFVTRIAPSKSSRKRPTAKAPLPIEAGMYDNCAERPYNRVQRAGLKLLGMMLGRQIV